MRPVAPGTRCAVCFGAIRGLPTVWTRYRPARNGFGDAVVSVFNPFFDAVGSILAFFYSFTNSYGFSIILLTIAVMGFVTPLTYKSTKSMLQMQRLQPELKRLQAEFKHDRERLNQELMAFYKANNLNPLGSCLPLLVQAPVFIVLYRVLSGLTARSGGALSAAGHIVGQTASNVSLTPWRLTDAPFNPQYVGTSTDLYRSLSNQSKMPFFGIDLSLTPIQAFRLGFLVFIPFAVLIAAMTVAQVIQNRQIQGRNKNQQVNAQQQAIMKFLPFMLPVISLNFPAGLGIYYFIQSLCRIGTQAYITRSLYGETSTPESTTPDKGSKSSATSDGGKGSGPVPERRPPPKPGTSAKSQAAQRKSSGEHRPTQAGRRSGTPRNSSNRRSGQGGG